MGDKGDKLTSDSSKSAEIIQNRLADLGDIRVKKMFGGHGIFEADKMFALIDSKGQIFLKTDDLNLSRFEEAGAVRHSKMPYFSIPDKVLGNDELFKEWTKISISISKG